MNFSNVHLVWLEFARPSGIERRAQRFLRSILIKKSISYETWWLAATCIIYIPSISMNCFNSRTSLVLRRTRAYSRKPARRQRSIFRLATGPPSSVLLDQIELCWIRQNFFPMLDHNWPNEIAHSYHVDQLKTRRLRISHCRKRPIVMI